MTLTTVSTAPAAGDAARPRRSDGGLSLSARGLSLGYGDRLVVDALDLELPAGSITAVLGANGSGKSTLLRGLARLLRPRAGQVLLDGVDLHRTPPRQVARRLAVLPQQPQAPAGMTVTELVARGRAPHRGWWRQWTSADTEAVERALAATDLAGEGATPLDELSGGQRQRAWIAMAVAQKTPVMLLDEPTSSLDLAHSLDVLDLVADLNAQHGCTVVLVLHDLNQACRYADRVVAMHRGRIVANGAPADVVTEDVVAQVFGLRSRVVPDPVTGTPLVVPLRDHRLRQP